MPRNASHLCFTMPQFDDETGVLYVPQFNPELMDYLVYGEETGEGGYKHWQGYVEMKCHIRDYKKIQQLLGGPAHLAQRRGSKKQAIAYCKKEGRVQEYGICVEQGKRTDLESARLKMVEGISQRELADQDFPSWCRNYRAFAQYAAMLKPERRDPFIRVIYGPPGSRKTTYVLNETDGKYDAYWKSPHHLWWDGYSGQKVVVIDEFRSQIPIAELLNMVSPGPHQLNLKGSTVWCKANLFIIVSNYPPEEWYMDADTVTKQALFRRIKEVLKVEDLQLDRQLVLPCPTSLTQQDIQKSIETSLQQKKEEMDIEKDQEIDEWSGISVSDVLSDTDSEQSILSTTSSQAEVGEPREYETFQNVLDLVRRARSGITNGANG